MVSQLVRRPGRQCFLHTKSSHDPCIKTSDITLCGRAYAQEDSGIASWTKLTQERAYMITPVIRQCFIMRSLLNIA